MTNNQERNKAITDEIRTVLTAALIIFVVLKLTHVLDWSWWWITSPFWLPIAILPIWIPAAFIYRKAKP